MKSPKKKITAETMPLPLPRIFYAGRGGYAIEHKGGYIPLPREGQVAAHLRKRGVVDECISGIICDIQLENFVSYIGAVAGHPPGLHVSVDSGENFLVTTGPKIPQGEPCPWVFIDEFLGELVGTGEQRAALESWLRQGRRNLLQQIRRPLPAAVLCGPRNGGKSLLIELARMTLGGRAAAAFNALSGTATFNGDVIGAELLFVDDEIASRDHRARCAFAQGLKKHLFAGAVRVEAKHRDAVVMRPIQAVVIAVNDEPEHLAVLPTIDDSLADKISLFSCQRARLRGMSDRQEIAAILREELPGFVHHLDTTEHPAHLTDQRTGAAAWQSPIVLEHLRSIAPEERFRELVAQCWHVQEEIESGGVWQGTAAELEAELLRAETTRAGARSLLTFNSACGVFLGRLACSGRADITSCIRRGITRWQIRSLEPNAPTFSEVEGLRGGGVLGNRTTEEKETVFINNRLQNNETSADPPPLHHSNNSTQQP
jgi:hypothetical protein